MDNQEKKSDDKKIIKHDHVIKNKENIIENTVDLQNKIINDLQSKLLYNKKKIHDIELRALANIENIKKNSEEKIKKIKNIEVEKFLKKVIPVIDSLEEILVLSRQSNLENQSVIQGIKLTLQSLFNILHKLEVKIEGEKNKLFNPVMHDAILTESSEIIPPNHIIFTHKKGFTFKKVLLRKAIVTISKN